MNYAEEITYWYLRLNGFFPLTNFVLHRTTLPHPSDCDILAVRPPYVYEKIGGNEADWDTLLFQHFTPGKTLGVVCEVKAGRYNPDRILRDQHVMYAISRLGLVQDPRPYEQAIHKERVVQLGEACQVMKLLVVDHQQPPTDRNYFYLSLQHIRGFIKERMGRYTEKSSDWTFFHSNVIQQIIWEVQQERATS